MEYFTKVNLLDLKYYTGPSTVKMKKKQQNGT